MARSPAVARVLSTTPGLVFEAVKPTADKDAYSEADLQRFMHGFQRAMCAAADTENMDVLGEFLQTAVPAHSAVGLPALGLLANSAGLLVTVSAAVLERLEGGERKDAAQWLALYTSTYIAQLYGLLAPHLPKGGGA
jgi:hypothetical protein